MKKGLSLLLALVLLLSLPACSLTFLNRYDGGSEDQEAPPVQSQEPVIPDTPDAPDAPGAPDEPGLPVQGEEPLLPDPDKSDDAASDPGENGAAKEITPSHTDVTLKAAGETFTLSARGVPGIYAASFTSADPAVAEVDELLGTVTAVAPGTTKVTMRVECELGQFDFDCIIRCSWKEDEEASLPASGTDSPSSGGLPSLSGFYATLQNSYEGLGAMMVMEGELLDNYYPGLSSIAAVEEILIQETMITTANVAVGLVRLSDSATMDDIVAVQNILQARIDSQADGGAFYPASCETWEQGVITSISNRVGMFVYPDSAQTLSDLFVAAYTN